MSKGEHIEMHIFLDQTLPVPGWIGKLYSRKENGELEPLPPLEGVLLSSSDPEEAKKRASEDFSLDAERIEVIQPC